MAVEMRDREEAAEMIGHRVFELRMARGYSQEKLGRLTGLSRETIRKVEAGETLPEITTIDVIAQGLEVPMMELLWDSDKRAYLYGSILSSLHPADLLTVAG